MHGHRQRTQVVQHAALNCLSNPATIQAPGGVKLPAFTRFSLMELSGVYMETTGKSHWIIDRGPGDVSPVPLGLGPVRPGAASAGAGTCGVRLGSGCG